MIEIKRNCSSSIHDNPLKDKITYGDFTIVLTENDYDLLDDIMLELKLNKLDALQEVIAAGLVYIEQQIDPHYAGEWQPKGMIE